MLGIFFFLALGLLVPKSSSFSTAAPPPLVRPSSTNDVLDTKAFAETATKKYTLSTKDVVNTVVVTGATGQTGRYVVEELLQRDVENVIAIVRDMKKATEVFPNPPANLQIKECDLCDVTQITNIMVNSNTDAAFVIDRSPLRRPHNLEQGRVVRRFPHQEPQERSESVRGRTAPRFAR
jgi:NAD(P)H-binding